MPPTAGAAEIAAALAHAEAAADLTARDHVQDASEPAVETVDDYEWLRRQRAAEADAHLAEADAADTA